MKAILFLLLFAFAYSLPNPVYMIKDCFEKLYDVKSNDVLQRSVTNELLNWKVDEFYEKSKNVLNKLAKITKDKELEFLKIK